MIEQARERLVPVSTTDILESLHRFGQVLGRASLTPEQVAAIEEELKAPASSPEMTDAIQNVGRAILLERSQQAVVEAMKTYGPPLRNSTSDQPRQMVLELASITGSVCRRLEVHFNWK